MKTKPKWRLQNNLQYKDWTCPAFIYIPAKNSTPKAMCNPHPVGSETFRILLVSTSNSPHQKPVDYIAGESNHATGQSIRRFLTCSKGQVNRPIRCVVPGRMMDPSTLVVAVSWVRRAAGYVLKGSGNWVFTVSDPWDMKCTYSSIQHDHSGTGKDFGKSSWRLWMSSTRIRRNLSALFHLYC